MLFPVSTLTDTYTVTITEEERSKHAGERKETIPSYYECLAASLLVVLQPHLCSAPVRVKHACTKPGYWSSFLSGICLVDVHIADRRAR